MLAFDFDDLDREKKINFTQIFHTNYIAFSTDRNGSETAKKHFVSEKVATAAVTPGLKTP